MESTEPNREGKSVILERVPSDILPASRTLAGQWTISHHRLPPLPLPLVQKIRSISFCDSKHLF